MATAMQVSDLSTCGRAQVGCVLTDIRRELMWIGYNGGYTNGPNECRHPGVEGGCGCIHAELNALLKADGSVDKLAYATTAPCPTCAVALINAHVVFVTYFAPYRDTEGLMILDEAGVPYRQHGPL